MRLENKPSILWVLYDKVFIVCFHFEFARASKIEEHWYISVANYIMQSEQHLHVFESDKQIKIFNFDLTATRNSYFVLGQTNRYQLICYVSPSSSFEVFYSAYDMFYGIST